MSRSVDPLYTARGQIHLYQQRLLRGATTVRIGCYLSAARRGALLRLPRSCEEILHEERRLA